MTSPAHGKFITIRLQDADLLAGIEQLQAQAGISTSELIRRSIRLFLQEQGILKAPRRPRSRKGGA